MPHMLWKIPIPPQNTLQLLLLHLDPAPTQSQDKQERNTQKNKKTKNNHFQRSVYMTHKKRTNEFYTRLMMGSCSVLAYCSYGFINPKPLYDPAVFKLLFAKTTHFQRSICMTQKNQ
jgi:hypothetical protein